ncbi:MAG: histidine phosphatase family protein [Rhodospirillales bacterium]|nr:histidine phosphatase family protein [Rhodospirillales bacterium]
MVGHTDVDAVIPDDPRLERIAKTLPSDADWLISPLIRCQQTAEALIACSEISIRTQHVIPRLQEQNFGDWENRSYDDPAIRDAKTFWDDPAQCAPPNGESFAAMMNRVHAAINEQPASENIVVVAHAGVIRAAISLALDLSPQQALRLQIDPMSVTRLGKFNDLENSSEGWSVRYVNHSVLADQN